MRDAFGGAFMIKIFIVFIFVYICLTAMALNYAKAFKVKNAVIEYLESNEIYNVTNMTAEELMTMDDFFNKELVGKRGYNVSSYQVCDNIIYDELQNKYCHPSGIVIEETGSAENTEGIYYTVTTYMNWGIPFLNKILALGGDNKDENEVTGLWKISGQTRLIVRD